MTLRRTNYIGSAVLAATTLVVAACSSGSGGYDVDPPPPAANTAPVVSAIADQSGNQDTVLGPIEFGISDRESDIAMLTITAAADGTNVFPADGIVLAGSGTTRTLTLTPLEAATGAANVTVTLTDPQGLSASRTFRVNVNARVASFRDTSLATFAKAETDEPTPISGFTFTQDADDPAIYEPLIGNE
jgi:hypothetical protein